ncbi:DUF885 domain-containing protein [Lacimicrobium alkaliphilum]|uniref:DUF885 domain-containing protein n=1 Tax=Lacimicrobium alkaliphilum TaxID=1526571 RepID=A0A0U3AEB0_9ALTE|nr:DUF885 domain-containing protein [Lacimicrobium alkaliphilum]ALS97025.1 hypothetical protein AT746_01175 [Lacimicrobium alkaliphilum]
MKKSLITLAVCASLLQACSTSSVNTTAVDPTLAGIMAEAKTADARLVALTDQYIEETLPREPINALFLGDNRFNHLWPNTLSAEFIAEGEAISSKYLTAVKQIDRASLKGQDLYTYDIFKGNLEQQLEGSAYPFELLPLNQFIFSPHNFFMQLGGGVSAQPFNNAKDFDNFLQRADGFVIWLDQAVINMRKGIDMNVVQPRPVVESMLPQIQAQLHEDPTQSDLFAPLNQAKDKLSEQDYQRLHSAYTELVDERLTPAFARLHTFLEQEYLPASRDSHGYSALPNGKSWYEFMIKTNTTLELSADEIHQTGLDEVARIHNEIREVARETGFEGSLEEFFEFLKTDPQFYFDSEEEILAAYEAVKERMAPKLETLFSKIPKADYMVRPYPPSQAKSAPGASYTPPAKDGSRPGIFFANTYNLKGQPKYGVETLSIHEASPGHHFQISLQQEIEGLPKIRSQNFYTAYAEGWALYAESLGKELGFFTDPYQYYGKLDAELFRAMRLVVDTGIHAKGWSREQAIDYMLANSTMARSDVESEVERYMIMPGQALSYKTGQLKMQELRDYAEQKLGERFDIKTFHNLILLDGPLPLPLLERKIKEWVASA